MSNPVVVKAIVTTLRNFDICLIQEIRDDNKVQPAIQQLLKNINDVNFKNLDEKTTINTKKALYDVVVSDRLGRTNSKEQYAFLFNTKKIQIAQALQYQDKENAFERPPFSVHIKIGTKSMIFSGVHISPGTAVSEIDKLVDVYQSLQQSDLTLAGKQALRNKWIVMGDFNAGCSYVPKSIWSKIRLRTDQSFRWLVPDSWDTTSKASACPYDRFVTPVPSASNADPIVAGSVGVFNLHDHYGRYIKDDDIPKISDHYPIFVTVNP